MSEAFMRRAIALACESVASGGGPFGAVIVRDGAVVAEGMNRVTLAHDPTAHAEIVAIRAACGAVGSHELRGCTVYTSCEPCPMCLGALHWARVDRILYAADREDAARAGFDDEAMYAELVMPLENRTVPITRMLAGDGPVPFEAWRAHAAKIAY